MALPAGALSLLRCRATRFAASYHQQRRFPPGTGIRRGSVQGRTGPACNRTRRAKMATTQTKTEGDILTVAEIERRYPDEWVLIEITRPHKDHGKKAGRLIAHSPNRHELTSPFERLVAAQPQARTYEFYTGDVVAPGVVAIL